LGCVVCYFAVSLSTGAADRTTGINKHRNMAVAEAPTTVVEVPNPDHKKPRETGSATEKKTAVPDSPEIKTAPPAYGDGSIQDKDSDNEDAIIVTGTDAATHLLPLRDDGDPALTFRSLFLATCLSAFQACMYQIYTVSWKMDTMSFSFSFPFLSPSLLP
jgi:hypothetical protein